MLRPSVGLLALVLAATGCALPDEGVLLDYDTYAPDRSLDLSAADRGQIPDQDDDAVQGGVLGPERVAVYVGDELLVDLLLEEPGLGELRPADLPEQSEFERHESGWLFRWVPTLLDVGTHDVHFLVVDAEEPSLVIGSHTLVVDVLPRFGLIEYGF